MILTHMVSKANFYFNWRLSSDIVIKLFFNSVFVLMFELEMQTDITQFRICLLIIVLLLNDISASQIALNKLNMCFCYWLRYVKYDN